MTAISTTEAVYSQLDSIYQDSTLQLIGSIGREMIMASYGYRQPPHVFMRPNGEYRDIDALSHGHESTDAIPAAAQSPLMLDLEFSKWVYPESDGIWLTFPSDSSVAEQVRPEVFDPTIRHSGDLACRTYSIHTQHKLNRLAGFERPKDRVAFAQYEDFMTFAAQNGQTTADTPLPAELYEPFERFAKGIREKHAGYLLACRLGVVVSSLPPGVKKQIKRLGAPVRRHFLS